MGDLKPDAMAIEGQSVGGALENVELMGSWVDHKTAKQGLRRHWALHLLYTRVSPLFAKKEAIRGSWHKSSTGDTRHF